VTKNKVVKKLILILFIALNYMGYSQESNLKFYDLFNSEKNPEVSCYRIPSIITTMNGDLIVAIDERVPSCGDLKWSRDINIVIRRSNDNGNSWSEIKRVVDYPLGKSASDPSMIFDRITNKIFLFYNYMDLDNEKDIYYLKYVTSSDNGITWSKPVDITSQISKPGWEKDFKFITSGRGIQAKNGDLLHCLVNLQNGTHVFGSKDHGKTWFLTETSVKPGDESKIVELKDGTWMVNSRANNKGIRYSHTSFNGGKDWLTKEENDLIDPGCNASFIQYNYGKYKRQTLLVLSNINNSKTRKEIVVRYSLDEGINWSKPRIVYSGEAAYSSMTILKNGEIGLFFEKDNYTKNVFTSFSLDWLLN